MAVSDALQSGPRQPELRTAVRNMPTNEGPPHRVIQVAGNIDVGALAQDAAGQVLDVIGREHPELVEESWDDI